MDEAFMPCNKKPGKSMKAIRALSALLFGAPVLAGCFPTNDALRAKLERRAKFDMNCDDLQFVSLEQTKGYTTTYGVTGCGRRLTYVLSAHTESWILNAEDGRPANRTPVEAPPPPPPHP